MAMMFKSFKMCPVLGHVLILMVGVAAVVNSQSTSTKKLERIQVADQWMIDSFGRVRIFHGFNSVQKGPPWYRIDILNTTRLEMFRDWGFNAVRLGAMWKAVEPYPGQSDSSFLVTLQTIVTTLEKYGLYVILDMHQDVLSVFNYSGHAVGYEGIPRWLIDKFPPAERPFPWPFEQPPTSYNWALGYFTEAVSVAFQQLYNDTAGAVGYLSSFWKQIASTFKNQSSVLGYELINEPWAGDIYHYPVLCPAKAGKMNLAPLYNRLNSAIRAVDDKTLIFYEPVTWGIIESDGILSTGFDTVPGGSEYNNRSVLSYHYYCWLLSSTGEGHYPLLERILCDMILGPKVMKTILSDIRHIGGSSFLTEFGLCSPDGDPESINTVECEFVMSLADQFLQSWTYWDSEFFDEAGEVRWNSVKPFARVYARAIAGIPQKMNFDLKTKGFHFEYLLDPSIKAPTEIFIPIIHYPSGFKVKTSAQLNWTFDKESHVLYVRPSGGKSNSLRASVDIY